MNYELDFISCEDTMPRGPFGFFNDVCTLSSVPILAVPLYFVHKALVVAPQPTHTLASSQRRQLQYYTLLNLLLFLGNLIQHATGYLGPPCMDTIGCAGGLCLCAIAYQAYYQTLDSHLSSDTSFKTKDPKHSQRYPRPWILQRLSPDTVSSITTSLAVIVLATPLIGGKEREAILTKSLKPLVDLLVVVLMGWTAWTQKVCLDAKRSWNLYRTCFGLFVSVLLFGEAEPRLCSSLNNTGKRLFHATFGHALISAMFTGVSALAFQVTRASSPSVASRY